MINRFNKSLPRHRGAKAGRLKLASPPVMLVIESPQVPREVHLRRPLQNCYRRPSKDSALWEKQPRVETHWPFAESWTFDENVIGVSRRVSLAWVGCLCGRESSSAQASTSVIPQWVPPQKQPTRGRV